MASGLVLSLFPGVDLLGMAFEQEGFCVVRGPDVIFGQDIKTFHPPIGRFDGVIGGPPCQAFSPTRNFNPSFVYENLIPEFCRCVEEAQPRWFLMENVTGAKMEPPKEFYTQRFVLNARHFGTPQNRVRKFWFGNKEGRAMCVVNQTDSGGKEPCVTATEMRIGHLPGSEKPARSLAEIKKLQQLPEDFDIPLFKKASKGLVIGNGVPLGMGRAIAKQIRYLYPQDALSASRSGDRNEALL